ncbi:ABC transporter permease subunit [Pseudalkalibacillus salsuginis]|uniref:ABC transporter permease subunit n=1 Tax=Pseudalkalibacillus salsuginis TaxID=2910972 RepID=UPI001F2324DD|nr:ABC transporter permease subunit [Pseudalkalibacillus salsuginis]MCF6411970.1 ABC transporter permease subunit [Pseudalkalibacillus salsuginis]
MRFFYNQVLRFACIVIGIVLMAGLPTLLPSGGSFHLNWMAYFQSIEEIISGLSHLQEVTYNTGGTERKLLTQLMSIGTYSVTIVVGAILLAFIAAAVLTFITMLLPPKWIRKIKVGTFILESIPDILIILICQLFVVWLYKKTGLLFFEIASLPGEPIYALPILCLSILPMIQYFKVMISIVEGELDKQYVELAKAKGVLQRKILLVHVLRNSLASLLNHSKTVIWFMLSNLLILEYIFNINGIMRFLLEYLNPVIFAWSLLAIFIPNFLLFAIGQWLLERSTNEKVVM